VSEPIQQFYVSLLDTKHHNRDDFACGEPSLDHYLKRQASQDIKRKAAAVYVMTESPNSETILGYYTLTAASINLEDVPEAAKKKLARYEDVSAVLLGRLALANQAKGQGLGGQLLKHALLQSLSLSEGLAAALVIVDALHEQAKQFYEHYGFVELPDRPMRLFMPMTTIKKTLAQG
jgi:predicted GNAT family N-acyltransferase